MGEASAALAAAAFTAPTRWRLRVDATLRRKAAAIAGLPVGEALWLVGAEGLGASDAAWVRAQVGNRPLVLELPVSTLRRLQLDRLVAALGADALLLQADVSDAAAALAAARARLRGANVALGLALQVGPADAAALGALAAWRADATAAGAALHIELQPRQAALRAEDDDADAAPEPVALVALLASLRALPAGVRCAASWPRQALPSAVQEVPAAPGSAPAWLAALADLAAVTPAAPTPPQLPRWPDAAEWIALELGLRRVWRIDLSPALADDLKRCAAEHGLAVLHGATTAIDDAGLWREDEDGRRVLYVGRNAADLAAADRLERATLALTAARAAQRESHVGGVDPAAENDLAMASLLGYPACCAAAFVEGHQRWLAADASHEAEVAAFALRAARATAAAGGIGDRRLDACNPCIGASPLRHYPCRLDCEASIALADAIDAEAWRRDPPREARERAARADATLVFASGAALPLRGTLDGGALREPTALLDRPLTWAPHAGALRAELVPWLAGARALRPMHDVAGPGGVWREGAAGERRALEAPGGFPQARPHPDYPRLLLFPP